MTRVYLFCCDECKLVGASRGEGLLPDVVLPNFDLCKPWRAAIGETGEALHLCADCAERRETGEQ